MDDNEIHYLTYEEEELWNAMVEAYIDAGGDVLYPGDEKEMLMRGMEQIIMQAFAGIDNALRMDTLRYAVRDYLDLYGEKRRCYRNKAKAAATTVRLTFLNSGIGKTIPAGSPLTADGSVIFQTTEDVEQDGYAGTTDVGIICSKAGSAGNGLLTGMEMQFLTPEDGISNITVLEDASGGQNEEDDESYRERIRVYGLATVTTGPATQYESVTKAVTSEIIDAKAINEGDGEVGVYLLLADESVSAAIISAVEDALTPDDARPLTDSVSVSLATKREYVLKVKYSVYSGANISASLQDAVERYQNWQDKTIGQAFNPDMLISYLYQAGCLRVLFDDESNFDGGTVEYTPIAENEYCNGTVTLEVIST
jgi:phage-related baseplate assembly protein